MDWDNKKVLVTGGNGVIGKELILRLIERGANIECFDIVPEPGIIQQKVVYHKIDLSDLDTKEFINLDPEIIFHLAATFERTVETPEFWSSNFKNNVLSTHNVIDVAKKCKSLRRFVFASSYLVYSPGLYLFETPPNKPIYLKEDALISPRNLCGASKYYAEKELEFLAKSYCHFTSVSARIFRVYGYGSKDVISRWVRAGLSKEKIELFGKENSFDFIFAGDVAEGLIKLAESHNAQGPVNLGTGISRKIEEVVKIISQEIPNLEIEEIKKKIHFEASSADIYLLRLLTGGWQPSTRLEFGIKNLIEKYKKLKV